MDAPKSFFVMAFWLIPFVAVGAEWNTPESKARWAELSQAMFGASAHLDKAQGLVRLDAPETAQDASLVPVTLKVEPTKDLKELDLIIDQNPSPIAARVRFGAAGDAHEMKFHVRVNAFTNMHAVGVLEDGRLLQDVQYVQGAGGCSAPMGMSEAEASANMGEMKMKFGGGSVDGGRFATLMVRHPNFNGMQMNDKTHAFTPARYIKSISVTRGAATIFQMSTDISLSTNPVIEFLYRPEVEAGKPIIVKVTDTTDTSWTRQFDAPGQG